MNRYHNLFCKRNIGAYFHAVDLNNGSTLLLFTFTGGLKFVVFFSKLRESIDCEIEKNCCIINEIGRCGFEIHIIDRAHKNVAA